MSTNALTNAATLQQNLTPESSWVIPLLVGGGLALLGTLMSQILALLAGSLQRRDEWRRVRREKFEEFSDCVMNTLPWFQKLSSCRSISDVLECQPPLEARRMVCLALLYFPELKGPAADYSNGLILYYHFAVDCCESFPLASVGARMAGHPEGEKRSNEVHVLRQRLDNAIEKVAHKYTRF